MVLLALSGRSLRVRSPLIVHELAVKSETLFLKVLRHVHWIKRIRIRELP